jgi:hypothetical protein
MTQTSEATLFCANHPDTPTSLRCNRCEKPICTKCAVLTPTGYRCTECVRSQQKVFNTAVWYDYIFAAVIALVLSYIGSRLAIIIGFFTILLAPAAGFVIAEAIRAVVRKRRSKQLFLTAAAAAAIGCLPVLFVEVLLPLTFGRGGLVFQLFDVIWILVYAVTVTSTLYYRLSGIQLRR